MRSQHNMTGPRRTKWSLYQPENKLQRGSSDQGFTTSFTEMHPITSDLQLKSHHLVVLQPPTNIPVQPSLHMGTLGKHLGKLSACLYWLLHQIFGCLLSWEVSFFSRIRHGAYHHPWEVCGDLLKGKSSCIHFFPKLSSKTNQDDRFDSGSNCELKLHSKHCGKNFKHLLRVPSDVRAF